MVYMVFKGFPSIPAHCFSNFSVHKIYCKEFYTQNCIYYNSGSNSRTYPRVMCTASDFCYLQIFRIQPWVRRQHHALLL